MVIDASVMVAQLVEPGRLTEPVLRDLAVGAEAPHLLDAEVGHVLRRRVRLGFLSLADGAFAIRNLRHAPIERTPHTALADRAWDLRDNLSFCDALYVSLAEQLEVPLLTFDARLAGAPGLRCEVRVL